MQLTPEQFVGLCGIKEPGQTIEFQDMASYKAWESKEIKENTREKLVAEARDEFRKAGFEV